VGVAGDPPTWYRLLAKDCAMGQSSVELISVAYLGRIVVRK